MGTLLKGLIGIGTIWYREQGQSKYEYILSLS